MYCIRREHKIENYHFQIIKIIIKNLQTVPVEKKWTRINTLICGLIWVKYMIVDCLLYTFDTIRNEYFIIFNMRWKKILKSYFTVSLTAAPLCGWWNFGFHWWTMEVLFVLKMKAEHFVLLFHDETVGEHTQYACSLFLCHLIGPNVALSKRNTA